MSPDGRQRAGVEYCVAVGQAVFRYSLMSPSHWIDLFDLKVVLLHRRRRLGSQRCGRCSM